MAISQETTDPNKVDVGVAVQWFEDFVDASENSRATSEQCRDYYDNIQYTQEELEVYEERKQPPVTKNRIKPKIDFMLGLERSERRDPQALPRNPEDLEGAQAATDSMRYVVDANAFDVEKSLAFGNLSVEGTAGIECTVEASEEGDAVLRLDHAQWDRLWYDPHSRRPDFKDAKYLGIVQWEDKEDVLADFPDAEEALEDMFSTASISETFDDAPRDRWVDRGRNRVRIARVWYHKGGVWYFGTFTGADWLEGPERSPFVDEDGQTAPGLIFQSQFITRENDRYGTVWPLLSIQDAINFRESKALHLTTVRQTYGTKAAGVDVPEVKAELAKADGHVEMPAGAKFGENFGILPTNDMADWQWRLLQEGKAEIDNMGAAAALSGKGGASSGRELIARQQGGKLELGPAFEALRQMEHRVYRWVWQRIKQFWTEPKMIRITDDPKNAKFVGLNKKLTRLDILEAQGLEITPAIAAHPLANEVVGIQNNVAEIDVDIIVDDSPDTASIVGEQFDRLASLYQANPSEIPFKLLIEASDLRNKDRLLEILEEQEESAGTGQAGQQQMVQAAQQVAIQGEAAKVENTQADTEKKRSETAENMSQVRENIAEAVGQELDNRLQPVQTLGQVFGL